MFKKLVEEVLSVKEINGIIEKFTKGIPLGYEVNIPISRQNADALYEEFGEDDRIIERPNGTVYIQLKALCKHETVLNGITISTISKDGVCALCCGINIESTAVKYNGLIPLVERMESDEQWLINVLTRINNAIKTQIDEGKPHNLLRIDECVETDVNCTFGRNELIDVFGRRIRASKIVLLNNKRFVDMCKKYNITPNTIPLQGVCSAGTMKAFYRKYDVSTVKYRDGLPFTVFRTASVNLTQDDKYFEIIVYKKSKHGKPMEFIKYMTEDNSMPIVYSDDDFVVLSIPVDSVFG